MDYKIIPLYRGIQGDYIKIFVSEKHEKTLNDEGWVSKEHELPKEASKKRGPKPKDESSELNKDESIGSD
jgi:hypothetical protein